MSDGEDEEKTPTEFPPSVPLSGISVDLAMSAKSSPEAGELSKTTASKLSANWLPPETKLGDWIVVAPVGKGGMGIVYKVEHANRRGRPYALKISLSAQDEDPEAKRARLIRTRREFSIVHQFEHPNIIAPGHFFLWPDPDDGDPCIIMPFVQGETLTKYCRERTPSLRFIFQGLLRPIASALGYIHGKGVHHRDVKPANIMVEDTGRPLLMDFGIARSDASGTLTGTEILTTYQFSAPEYLAYFNSDLRANMEPFPYTDTTDIFCLGATFFELLTGWLPYAHVLPPGIAEAQGAYLSPAFLRELATFEPMPASLRNPALPHALDELFLRMMARDPAQRLSSGQEVVDAVDELLATLPEPDGVFDAAFAPPPRQKATAAPSPTVNGRKKKPGDSGRAPSGPRSPGSRQSQQAPASSGSVLVDPSLVAENSGFKAPLPAKAAAVEGPKSEVLPSVIRRAQAQLADSSPRKVSPLVLVGVVVVLIFLLGTGGVVLSAANRQAAGPRPQSLLDEKAPAAAIAKPPPMPVLPADPTPAAVAQAPAPVDAGALLVMAEPQRRPAAPPKANDDAKAVDAILAANYGGQRPVVGQQPGQGGTTTPPAPKPKASWIHGDLGDDEAKPVAKSFGVPIGTEIAARLMKPLDSRTTSSGPAVIRLPRPLVVRGHPVLPSGTMFYGVATANADRFNIKITRFKLTDGSEYPIDASVFDVDDKKPGLKASQHIRGGGGNQGPSVATQVAKGAASTLLGAAAGNDVAGQVVKGAGQTAINSSDGTSGSAGQADALLLDAPTDFTIFVNAAF